MAQDVDFTDVSGRCVFDSRDGGVVGGELGPAGDIFGVSVGEVGSDDQLLAGAGSKDGVFREDFESFESWSVVGWRPVSGGDPFGQHLVFA